MRVIAAARCTVLAMVLSTTAGCESPPAFVVPPGPARSVAVDVELPVYVMSRYAIGGFVDALRIELEKYHVEIVQPGTPGTPAAVEIDLGQITYRRWQSVEVRGAIGGKQQPIGSVRLPDLHESTLEASAQPVAVIVARYVWCMAPAATTPAR